MYHNIMVINYYLSYKLPFLKFFKIKPKLCFKTGVFAFGYLVIYLLKNKFFRYKLLEVIGR